MWFCGNVAEHTEAPQQSQKIFQTLSLSVYGASRKHKYYKHKNNLSRVHTLLI